MSIALDHTVPANGRLLKRAVSDYLDAFDTLDDGTEESWGNDGEVIPGCGEDFSDRVDY